MGNMYHLEKLKFNFLLSDFPECSFGKAWYRTVFSFLFLFPTLLKEKKKKNNLPKWKKNNNNNRKKKNSLWIQ